MLLSINHAAQRLDVHPSTVRRWVREGLLSCVRLPSGRLRIKEEELARIANPGDRVDRLLASL